MNDAVFTTPNRGDEGFVTKKVRELRAVVPGISAHEILLPKAQGKNEDGMSSVGHVVQCTDSDSD